MLQTLWTVGPFDLLFWLLPHSTPQEDKEYFQACTVSAWMIWHSDFSSAVSLLLSLLDDSLHWDFSWYFSSVPPHTNNTWAQSYVNVQDVCLHCKVIKVGVAALSWREVKTGQLDLSRPCLFTYRERDREGEKWNESRWVEEKTKKGKRVSRNRRK